MFRDIFEENLTSKNTDEMIELNQSFKNLYLMIQSPNFKCDDIF